MSWSDLYPFPVDPPIEELEARFRLIQRHHMARSMESHEGEVAAALDLTNLAIVGAKL